MHQGRQSGAPALLGRRDKNGVDPTGLAIDRPFTGATSIGAATSMRHPPQRRCSSRETARLASGPSSTPQPCRDFLIRPSSSCAAAVAAGTAVKAPRLDVCSSGAAHAVVLAAERGPISLSPSRPWRGVAHPDVKVRKGKGEVSPPSPVFHPQIVSRGGSRPRVSCPKPTEVGVSSASTSSASSWLSPPPTAVMVRQRIKDAAASANHLARRSVERSVDAAGGGVDAPQAAAIATAKKSPPTAVAHRRHIRCHERGGEVHGPEDDAQRAQKQSVTAGVLRGDSAEVDPQSGLHVDQIEPEIDTNREEEAALRRHSPSAIREMQRREPHRCPCGRIATASSTFMIDSSTRDKKEAGHSTVSSPVAHAAVLAGVQSVLKAKEASKEEVRVALQTAYNHCVALQQRLARAERHAGISMRSMSRESRAQSTTDDMPPRSLAASPPSLMPATAGRSSLREERLHCREGSANARSSASVSRSVGVYEMPRASPRSSATISRQNSPSSSAASSSWGREAPAVLSAVTSASWAARPGGCGDRSLDGEGPRNDMKTWLRRRVSQVVGHMEAEHEDHSNCSPAARLGEGAPQNVGARCPALSVAAVLPPPMEQSEVHIRCCLVKSPIFLNTATEGRAVDEGASQRLLTATMDSSDSDDALPPTRRAPHSGRVIDSTACRAVGSSDDGDGPSGHRVVSSRPPTVVRTAPRSNAGKSSPTPAERRPPALLLSPTCAGNWDEEPSTEMLRLPRRRRQQQQPSASHAIAGEAPSRGLEGKRRSLYLKRLDDASELESALVWPSSSTSRSVEKTLSSRAAHGTALLSPVGTGGSLPIDPSCVSTPASAASRPRSGVHCTDGVALPMGNVVLPSALQHHRSTAVLSPIADRTAALADGTVLVDLCCGAAPYLQPSLPSERVASLGSRASLLSVDSLHRHALSACSQNSSTSAQSTASANMKLQRRLQHDDGVALSIRGEAGRAALRQWRREAARMKTLPASEMFTAANRLEEKSVCAGEEAPWEVASPEL